MSDIRNVSETLIYYTHSVCNDVSNTPKFLDTSMAQQIYEHSKYMLVMNTH